MGIVLIFSTTIYRFLRGFWVLGVYFLLSNPSSLTIFYVVSGIAALAVITLIYSWLYFRKFLFHIDYASKEFVLQKGVFSTEDIAIPFDKIQQVYLKRSILQRVINVYSVVIETAGSKQDEVNIKAMTGEEANLLADILIKAKKKSPTHEEETQEAEGEMPQEREPGWTHKLDILTLLKIGISTNYIRGFALVLAFFATIYNELNSLSRNYAEEFNEYYERVPELTASAGLFIILFILLLLVSIIITVLEVFLKYYGLKLVQTRESLELEMGLKTNTKVSLQPRRVQLMQVITNPVQKYFNLYEARIALASSENDLQKKKIKIPGLQKETVGKINSFLYNTEEKSFEQMFRPHKLMLIRRLIIVFVPAVLITLFYQLQPFMDIGLMIFLVILYLFLGVLYQIKRFQSLQLIFSNDFLQKKQGVWNSREERFELFKLQAVSVRQPFWYKRRKLVNLVFHTAGGDITFKAVTQKVIPYINYILYKAEVTHRRWM